MKKVYVSYHTQMGSIKSNSDKIGFSIKNIEITKDFNSLFYFKVEGEDFERKISKKDLNIIRDFGTSVYGVFEIEDDTDIKLFCNEVIDKMIEALNKRIEMSFKDIEEGLKPNKEKII